MMVVQRKGALGNPLGKTESERNRKKDRLSSVSVEVGKRGRERDSPGDTLDCIALVGREREKAALNKPTEQQPR